jgi:large subunit ribosomal protein L33
MFLTNILFKKVKTKRILVLCESLVSGHRLYIPRDRLADKLEFIRVDPFVRKEVVYKEVKKLKGIKGS